MFVDDVSAELANHDPGVVERQLAGFLLSVCSRLTADGLENFSQQIRRHGIDEEGGRNNMQTPQTNRDQVREEGQILRDWIFCCKDTPVHKRRRRSRIQTAINYNPLGGLAITLKRGSERLSARPVYPPRLP